MTNKKKIQPAVATCRGCGQGKVEGDIVYHVEFGKVDENGEFVPEEEIGLFDSHCIIMADENPLEEPIIKISPEPDDFDLMDEKERVEQLLKEKEEIE